MSQMTKLFAFLIWLAFYNRISQFLWGCLILGLISYDIYMTAELGKLSFVKVFRAVACTAMGGWIIWVSLAYRDRPSANQELMEAWTAPEYSEDALVCDFWTGYTDAKVIVDDYAGMIHFGNCHWSRGFLEGNPEWYSCPLATLKGLYRYKRKKRKYLWIITDAGKVLIPDSATHFPKLYVQLLDAVPKNKPGYFTDSPMLARNLGIGTILGLFGGLAWGLTMMPLNTGIETVAALGFGSGLVAFLGVYIVGQLSDYLNRMTDEARKTSFYS